MVVARCCLASLQQRGAGETGENSTDGTATTAAGHDSGGGGQLDWSRWCLADRPGRRPVTMPPVMGTGIESRVCR